MMERRSAANWRCADLALLHQAREDPQYDLAYRRRALHGGPLLRSQQGQVSGFRWLFWELVSGPIHAGTFGPNDLDGTFGPQLIYVKAPSKEQGQNLPPSMGLQFFGHVKVDGKTEQLTVTLRDLADTALWSRTLDPLRA